ncbi:hypothetical protein BS78_K304200 [Paspalum vaginatum]|uniref:Uncharacterized protein n=1 Tax=Paspalum vaginatum TaxID=158149 RepID=A0A9W8CEU2_9POAL|nr:hypothetical protein BS78_K304200 [Paspalum vaginatum]
MVPTAARPRGGGGRLGTSVQTGAEIRSACRLVPLLLLLHLEERRCHRPCVLLRRPLSLRLPRRRRRQPCHAPRARQPLRLRPRHGALCPCSGPTARRRRRRSPWVLALVALGEAESRALAWQEFAEMLLVNSCFVVFFLKGEERTEEAHIWDEIYTMQDCIL